MLYPKGTSAANLASQISAGSEPEFLQRPVRLARPPRPDPNDFGKEFAHFHRDNELDQRLTRKVIQAEHIRHTAV